jgi:hypothetical protein
MVDVFKRVRTSQSHLESGVRVEHLLDQRPDIKAVALLLMIQDDMLYHAYNLDADNNLDSLKKTSMRTAQYICDELKSDKTGMHDGNCIGRSYTCERCVLEELCELALETIEKYRQQETNEYVELLTPQMGKDVLSLFNGYLDHAQLLEIIGITMSSYTDIWKFLTSNSKIDHEYPDFKFEYNKWKSMSTDERMKYIKRAEEFYELMTTNQFV